MEYLGWMLVGLLEVLEDRDAMEAARGKDQ